MTGGAALALALDGAWGGRPADGAASRPLDAGLSLSLFRPSEGPGRLDLPDLRPAETKPPQKAIERAIPAARVARSIDAPRRTPALPMPKSTSYAGGPLPSFTWPSEGMVTSPFGYRVLRGRFRHHSGVDVRAPYGTPIRTAAAGEVVFAGWRGGYGRLVVVDHGGGVRTWYAHNRSVRVAAGTKVGAGDVIALAGDSGHAFGPHTHFEIRLGDVPIDPLRYLAARAEPEIAQAPSSYGNDASDTGEGVGGP